MRLTLIFAMSLALGGISAPAQSQTPPPAVVVAKVKSQKSELNDSYVGRVQAVSTVQVVARVEGVLEQRDFTEGGLVKSGDELFIIEQDLYQASVDQAQATLDGAVATAKNAEIDFNRQQALLEKGDVPQSVVDAAAAVLGADQAAVAEAKAQLEQAKINLGFTTITSPIDGRISQAEVDEGNLINPQSGVLATITSVDPIYVNFFVSERDLIEKRREGLVQDNSASLTVQIRLSDGAMYDQGGAIDYIGNQVQSATDTVEVRASFANDAGLLIPGQVVTVTFQDPNAKSVLVIPQTAIQLDAKGHFVYVVGADNKVERRDIVIGTQTGRDWEVSSGLKSDESVIVQGIQKVKEGETVAPTEAKS